MPTTRTNRSGLALVALALAIGNGCGSGMLGSQGGGGQAGGSTAGTVGTAGSGGTGGTIVDGSSDAGAQGNPDADGGVLACAMSVERACARDGGPGACDLTWSAVLADSSLCATGTTQSRNLVSTCGGYHVLSYFFLDGGSDFYYDGTTGALVAILGVGINASPPCIGGPMAGFAPPSGCNTGFEPPQCTGDAGGADGAKG